MNIFLLHRDIRIEDNIGLIKLLEQNQEVYLFFIFTKKQIENNKLFNEKSFNLLLNVLKELNVKYHINFFYVDNELDLFKEILNKEKISRIYTNYDFSPFAINRTNILKTFCEDKNIEFKTFNDYLLFKPGTILNKSYQPFKIFKSFHLKAMKTKINKPYNYDYQKIKFLKYKNKFSIELPKFKITEANVIYKRNKLMQLLSSLTNKHYIEQRDNFYIDTSYMATSIKYGVISCREFIVLVLKNNNLDCDIIRQFIWREFYYHTFYLNYRDNNFNFGKNLLTKFNDFKWDNNMNLFNKWKEGKTGFPLIDVAMKNLNQTGIMHNRLRMITASFLIKNLSIDWRYGERYFAIKLVDYDPIVNNLSWQWSSGTGFESNPFFRIFSIESQIKRFDPENIYLKKYKNLIEKDIKPIIDLKESRKIALEKYQKIKK